MRRRRRAAGIALFLEKGFEKVSVAEIAADSDIARLREALTRAVSRLHVLHSGELPF